MGGFWPDKKIFQQSIRGYAIVCHLQVCTKVKNNTDTALDRVRSTLLSTGFFDSLRALILLTGCH